MMQPTILVLDGGREISLSESAPCACGGFGQIYRGVTRGRRVTEVIPVAVKFLSMPRPRSLSEGVTAERYRAEERRFQHEVKMLKRLNALARRNPNKLGHCEQSHWIIPQQFPKFFGQGKLRGRPFYVMEWLEPIDFSAFQTESDRVMFALGLCESVSWLHRMGFVHCDLKPANIMQRSGGGAAKYAYIDFGSIHKKEEPLRDGEVRRNGCRSMSVGRNGRRYYPHTPGYADPMYDRHTIYFDIYSIGQVLRDLFTDDVPPSWAQIINKCTSRWWQYRYGSVDELAEDIGHLDEERMSTYQMYKRDFDRCELERQLSVGGSHWPHDFAELKWDDILEKGARPKGRGNAWYWTIDKIIVYDASGRPVSLTGTRSYRIVEPLVLPPGVCLVVSGSFSLVAPVVGSASSAIILSDGACFHNSAPQGAGGDQSSYVVTTRSYLNFPRGVTGVSGHEQSIRTRVFQSPHDVTHVGFEGPADWIGLRRLAAKRAESTALPAFFKKELVSFLQGNDLKVDKDGFWRMGKNRP